MKNEEIYKEKRKKLLLYLKELAKDKGISQEEIAKKTGFKQSNVSRLLNGIYPPTLDNLIRLAEAINHDVVFANKYLNEKVPDEFIFPKFLFSIDPISKELYILHRAFPSCLIHVKQETPVRFIVLDLYDEVENPNDILNMPFVQEAKNFYKKYAESIMPSN
jgi:transcriptional regulator with XRE-family HTH domain